MRAQAGAGHLWLVTRPEPQGRCPGVAHLLTSHLPSFSFLLHLPSSPSCFSFLITSCAGIYFSIGRDSPCFTSPAPEVMSELALLGDNTLFLGFYSVISWAWFLRWNPCLYPSLGRAFCNGLGIGKWEPPRTLEERLSGWPGFLDGREGKAPTS